MIGIVYDAESDGLSVLSTADGAVAWANNLIARITEMDAATDIWICHAQRGLAKISPSHAIRLFTDTGEEITDTSNSTTNTKTKGLQPRKPFLATTKQLWVWSKIG